MFLLPYITAQCEEPLTISWSDRDRETGVETYMHEKPSGDAAKQREGRVVDTVMHHAKYQGMNCFSTFSVFEDFLSLEFATSSHIVPVLLFMSFGNLLLERSFLYQIVPPPPAIQTCSFWKVL